MRLNTRVLRAILVLAACGKNGDGSNPPDPGPDGKPSPIPTIPNTAPILAPTALVCPTGTYLTYENFGESFMSNYCTSCHSSKLTGAARNGAPVGADYDSATGVSIWRADIYQYVLGQTPTMPPAGNVLPLDLSMLSEWLNCGAPSDTGKSRL